MNIFEQRESQIRAYCNVYPTVFDKASNARQTDVDGREFIDFFAGAGVLNFGHNNPRMVSAVVDYLQSGGVIHSLDMYSTSKQAFIEKYAGTILEPRNMPHKLQFTGPTGTNAVEAALKLARRATGRRQIVAFTHGFHGMTLGSLACTANSAFRNAAGVPLEHVVHLPFGCEEPCNGCDLGCGIAAIDRLRALYHDTSSGWHKPAGFLVETVQAEGGVKVASREWLRALADLAREVEAPLIVDDIQVGCGRTGSYFSFDDLGIDPDIICQAKGVGGLGTPLAFNLVKPEYDRHWAPGEHTGTFRGQNISFVAGAVGLEYFDDNDFMSAVKSHGKTMYTALEPLAMKYADVQVRGKGMLLGVDVGNGDNARKIVAGCFDRGLLVSACGTGGRVVKVIPPLTIPEEDLREGLDILAAVTAKVMEAA